MFQMKFKEEGDPPKKYKGLGCVLLIVLPVVLGAFSNFVDEQILIMVMGIICIPIMFYLFIWREYTKEDIENTFSFKNFGKGPVKNIGVCPKCWKKISVLSSKCPHCTANIG